MRTLLKYALTALVLGAAAAPARAETAFATPRPDVSADLLIGDHDRTDPALAWLGVRVRLGPGWKTYWVSPGDGGLPPEFDWSGSPAIAASETLWPAPHRMTVQGVDTIGYSGEVVFPIRVRLADPGAASPVSLKLALYACSTICVRQDMQLSGTLAPPGGSGGAQPEIDRWLSRVPAAEVGGLKILRVDITRADAPELAVDVSASGGLSDPDVFVNADPPVNTGRPRIERHPDGTTTLVSRLDGDRPETLAQRAMSVVVVDGERSVQAARKPADVGSGPLPGAPPEARSSFGWMLGLGVLAGLVLNLMPCVFPVLSLKLLAFVGAEHVEHRRIRAGLLASAAGMIASFAALAAALVAIRAAGGAVGWGIQFQQPVFLAAMAVITAGFAASLLGLFDLFLPSVVADRADRVGRGTSLGAHFGSGFVATLLATPCSAPLVGTAVGFALSGGVVETLGIFLALGAGMAAPYLLIAAIPGLARRLPRPGRWMLTAKRAMAAGLFGTAVWLLVLLSSVAGLAASALLTLLLATVLALLAWRCGTGLAQRTVALVVVVAAPAVVVGLSLATADTRAGTREGISWRPFREQDIPGLVRAGQTVFVDVTAAWCITCKVNEAVTLDAPEVKDRLAGPVVAIKADWTRPDERIAAYLRQFGRFGIPFNIVYGPGAPSGIVLPELLTTQSVLDALAVASGGTARAASLVNKD